MTSKCKNLDYLISNTLSGCSSDLGRLEQSTQKSGRICGILFHKNVPWASSLKNKCGNSFLRSSKKNPDLQHSIHLPLKIPDFRLQLHIVKGGKTCGIRRLVCTPDMRENVIFSSQAFVLKGRTYRPRIQSKIRENESFHFLCLF